MEKHKPQVSFKGVDGNVFNLLAACTKALKAHGLKDQAKELTAKVFTSDSYGNALMYMAEYVEITWG